MTETLSFAEIDKKLQSARQLQGHGSNAQASPQADADYKGLHTHFDYIADIKISPPEWLVDQVITGNILAAIVGASYSGKSLYAIALCCCVAAGIDFHGHPVKQGSVVYIAAEGRTGLLSRVEAWRIANDQQDTNLPFILSKTAINMRDPAMVASIKTLIGKVPDLRLIVIDTLNRNYGGGNENESGDMGQFINSCDELIEHFGCTVAVVHHLGKDQSAGARGHSSFYAALDTEITVKAIGDDDVQVSCTKQKDAPEFDQMQFIKVPTGDSVVLEPVAVTKASRKTSPADRYALDSLSVTFDEIGRSSAHVDEWRPNFYAGHTADSPDAKRKAFNRARQSLINNGLVDCKDDKYTLRDTVT